MKLKLHWFFFDELYTEIIADYDRRKVTFTDFKESIMDTAFGTRSKPTWQDYEDLLLSRCFDEGRQDKNEILSDLGLVAYCPELILKKTKGIIQGDPYKLKIVGEAYGD